MRKYAYIMIGGALGAMLRLAVKSISTGQYQGRFPINTLIINITGTFILALFLTISLEVLEVGADIRLTAYRPVSLEHIPLFRLSARRLLC